MKLQVIFTVEVEACDEDARPLESIDPEDIESSVAEAITNAIEYAEGVGHTHTLERDISILAASDIHGRRSGIKDKLLALLAEYENESGLLQSAMRDLLTDLRHIADDQGIDFDSVNGHAKGVYQAELED